MQEKRKRSMAERKIQAEVQLSEKAKVQERLLALEAYRRSQGNNAAAKEEVRSFPVCTKVEFTIRYTRHNTCPHFLTIL